MSPNKLVYRCSYFRLPQEKLMCRCYILNECKDINHGYEHIGVVSAANNPCYVSMAANNSAVCEIVHSLQYCDVQYYICNYLCFARHRPPLKCLKNA